MPKKHRKRSKQTRQHPRRTLVPQEIPEKTSFWLFERAESLSPSVRTMDAYVAGQPEAIAIIHSWAFRFPIAWRQYVAA